jgi:hypothetical protein
MAYLCDLVFICLCFIVLDLNMISYDSLLSSGHFGYSLIRFRVQTRKLRYFTFSYVVLSSSSCIESNSSTFCQSFIVFLVCEGVHGL